jgi:hypothetical protein
MKDLRYIKPMDRRLDQLTPETIDRLAQNAQAEGLSLDAYLNVLLGLLNEGTALAPTSEAEFEALIEDFSKGSEHFPPLPPDFSRADRRDDSPCLASASRGDLDLVWSLRL